MYKNGSKANQGKQDAESSITLWSLIQLLPPGSCLEFMPRLPSMMDYNMQTKTNHFLPQVALG